LYVGLGNKCKKYASLLRENGCEFIDLVNKTSIFELAQLVKICRAAVSVDTGTLHLSYSLGIPTVAIFYDEEFILNWSPDESLYNVKVLDAKSSAESLIFELKNILNSEKGDSDV
jgi:ADP-heptose:LPS heptosyltransferase